jgi:hypothetical protein
MDLPNFKDILSKLSVFRNKSLLIPVVISLISVLLFIPTQLMSSGLKEQVQKESITEGYDKVKHLLESSVSDDLLKKEKDQLEIREKDANEIELLAIQTTQRQLLSNNIFDVNDPNSLPGLTFLQFGQKFTGGIDKMIADSKAGDCPTEAELNREIDKSGVKNRGMGMTGGMYDSRNIITTRPGGPSRGPSRGGRNLQRGSRMMGELEMVVANQLCKKRAEEISFYVTPIQLSGYIFWKEYNINVQKVEAVKDCWYYQLAYWVIEDVFDTIVSMNSGHENTLNAPVKRLVRLGFSIDSGYSFMRSGGRRGGGAAGNKTNENDDRPVYVLSSDKKTMLSETCTGRYCNDDIDVIHFNVVCIVSTKDIMSFMKELCSLKEHQYIDESGQTHTYKHNQISIIESKFYSVDKEGMDNLYYVYGDDGVVELDLVCEYIFKKEGYEHLKPESVKTALLGEEEK